MERNLNSVVNRDKQENNIEDGDALNNSAQDHEEADKILRKGINQCIICMEDYSDKNKPRVVSCGHTICTVCLETILSRGSKNVCPQCKRERVMVKDAPVNYEIVNIMDNLKVNASNLKKLHKDKYNEYKNNFENNEEDHCNMNFGEICKNHSKNRAISYCGDCSIFTCSECAIIHTEEAHKVKFIHIKHHNRIKKAQTEFASVVEDLEKVETKILDSLTQKILKDKSLEGYINQSIAAIDDKINYLQSVKLQIYSFKKQYEKKLNDLMRELNSAKDKYTHTAISVYNAAFCLNNTVVNINESIFNPQVKIDLMEKLGDPDKEENFNKEFFVFIENQEKLNKNVEQGFISIEKEVCKLLSEENKKVVVDLFNDKNIDSYFYNKKEPKEFYLARIESLSTNLLDHLQSSFYEILYKCNNKMYLSIKNIENDYLN